MGTSIADDRVFETVAACLRYGLTGRIRVLTERMWKVEYGGREIVRQTGGSGSAKAMLEFADLPLARYLAHAINIALLRANLAESAVYALQGVNADLVEIVAALEQARERDRIYGGSPSGHPTSTPAQLLAVEHLVLGQLEVTGPLTPAPVALTSWHPPRVGRGQTARDAAARFGVTNPTPGPGSLDDLGGAWRRDDGRPNQLLVDIHWWLRLIDGASSGLPPIADRLDRAVEHLGIIASSPGGRLAVSRVELVAERLQVASLAVRGIKALHDGRGR